MCHGFPRNFSQIYASAMISEHGSCKKAWVEIKSRWEKAFDSLNKTMQILAEQVNKTDEAFVNLRASTNN